VYACIGIVASGANPNNKWRLTQDIYSLTVPIPSDIVFTDLADFWSALIWDNDILEEIRVYNWVLGTQPYPSGLPIFVIPYGTFGTASGDWVHTPSTAPYAGNEVVIRIDKEHNGIGKPGRTFARNLVRSSDIEASDDGPWVFVPGTPFNQTHLNSIVTATGWGTHFAGGSASAQAVVVQASRKHDTVHGYGQITQLQLVGVSTNKPTRKGKK
jgi:hypothetical protein